MGKRWLCCAARASVCPSDEARERRRGAATHVLSHVTFLEIGVCKSAAAYPTISQALPRTRAWNATTDDAN